MASVEAVKCSVDKLTAAFGRNTSESSYEAFSDCLGDINDAEVEVATTRLLRGGGQFLPSAGELRRAALEFRQERREVEDQTEKQPRIECLKCEGRGHLLTFNRYWLDEFVDQFCESWFVSGWVREAYLWCKQNRREDLFQTVVCDCGCKKAKTFLDQIERWEKSDPADKKIPYPAFRRWFDARYDCIIPCPMPPGNRAQWYKELLLQWKAGA